MQVPSTLILDMVSPFRNLVGYVGRVNFKRATTKVELCFWNVEYR
jgi:hypothetical protein